MINIDTNKDTRVAIVPLQEWEALTQYKRSMNEGKAVFIQTYSQLYGYNCYEITRDQAIDGMNEHVKELERIVKKEKELSKGIRKSSLLGLFKIWKELKK